jgi:hypothetical protein
LFVNGTVGANSTTVLSTDLSFASGPSSVFVDGVNKTVGDDWNWNAASSTLTLWYVFTLGHASATFTVNSSLGSTVLTVASRSAWVFAVIYAAMALMGLVPVALILYALTKFQLDTKTTVVLMFLLIMIVFVMMVLFYIVAAFSNIA